MESCARWHATGRKVGYGAKLRLLAHAVGE
jgi:hypothetical protein